MPHVVLTGYRLDPRLLALTRAVQLAGHTYQLHLLSPGINSSDLDEMECVKRLNHGSDIVCTWSKDGEPPPASADLAVLAVHGTFSPEQRAQMLRFVSRIKRRQILYREQTSLLRFQLGQWVKELKSPLLASSSLPIWLEDGRLPLLSFLLRKNFDYMGIFPHPMYLASRDLLSQLNVKKKYDSEYLLGYAGSWNALRAPLIKWMEPQLTPIAGGAFGEHTFGAEKRPVYWVNDSADSKRVRLPGEYLEALSRSQFTLCPAGYIGYTHRVLETLCRGGVPVFPGETQPYYKLPLVHLKNCILVQNGDWATAVHTILNLSPEEVEKMRANVNELTKGEADPEKILIRMAKEMFE